jgi:hypothetical protein
MFLLLGATPRGFMERYKNVFPFNILGHLFDVGAAFQAAMEAPGFPQVEEAASLD